MEIKTYKVTFCPYCRSEISLDLPFSLESHNRAEIHLTNSSTMLMPDDITSDNKISKASTSHTASISLEGYYCDPECLIKHIAFHLNPSKKVKISENKLKAWLNSDRTVKKEAEDDIDDIPF